MKPLVVILMTWFPLLAATWCSTSAVGPALNSVVMSIFTGRELEFLASLRTSWKRLYWNELARLLKEG